MPLLNEKFIYSFRGFIAFVAFTHIGTAVRSFTEGKCPFHDSSESRASIDTRIYGSFCLLHATMLVHCSLFIHCKPVISMTLCSLFMTITTNMYEVIMHNKKLVDFRTLYPCILNGLTVIGLIVPMMLDKCCAKTAILSDEDNERYELNLKRHTYLNTKQQNLFKKDF